MTQITPFQVPTFEEQASQLAFDTYITDDEKTAIHYRISSEKNTLLISSNFILTDEEFNAWGDTMESLNEIVLNRLGLKKA